MYFNTSGYTAFLKLYLDVRRFTINNVELNGKQHRITLTNIHTEELAVKPLIQTSVKDHPLHVKVHPHPCCSSHFLLRLHHFSSILSLFPLYLIFIIALHSCSIPPSSASLALYLHFLAAILAAELRPRASGHGVPDGLVSRRF